MSSRTEAIAAVLMRIGPLLDAIKSVLISEPKHIGLVGEIRGCYRTMAALLRSIKTKLVSGNETDYHYDDDEGAIDRLETETAAPTQQRVVRRRGVSRDDVKVVVARLGMVTRSSDDDEDDGDGDGTAEGEALEAMLEEKHASLEELREAFYVFDKNEDGFITPGELWCVMRRLGLQEGVRLDDCERMIRAYDEDGDGRISFGEFRALMENAT